MRITIRVYRVHDFDLLYLYKSKNIKLGAIMKKAIVAFYKGETLKFAMDPEVPVPADLPTSAQLAIYISNQDAEGIEDWIAKIPPGYRCSCFKNITRIFLSAFPIWAYRNDTWISGISNPKEGKQLGKQKRITTAPKLMPTEEWLEMVEKGAASDHEVAQSTEGKELSVPEENIKNAQPEETVLLTTPEKQLEIPKDTEEIAAVQHHQEEISETIEPDEEEVEDQDDFDAFDSFLELTDSK